MKEVRKVLNKYNEGKDFADKIVPLPLPLISKIEDMFEMMAEVEELLQEYNKLLQEKPDASNSEKERREVQDH